MCVRNDTAISTPSAVLKRWYDIFLSSLSKDWILINVQYRRNVVSGSLALLYDLLLLIYVMTRKIVSVIF